MRTVESTRMKKTADQVLWYRGEFGAQSPCRMRVYRPSAEERIHMSRIVTNPVRSACAGLLVAVIPILCSCAPQGSVRAGRAPVAQAAAKKSATPTAKPDPLLGKWVMIADNGGGGNGAIADYHADGWVLVTYKGKVNKTRYRRESGKAWVERRTGGMSGTGGKKQEMQDALKQFTKPGVEMIEFAGTDGKYLDYGGSLLTLDPDRRVLYNILTQAWCRPGDEARVKAMFQH
jgi:hypothetical protein